EADVRTVVSLVSRSELFWMQDQRPVSYNQPLFRQNYFPVVDGMAPSRSRMCTILDTVDRSVEQFEGVYAHCMGGRGRTGTVVACWLARHGVANGPGV